MKQASEMYEELQCAVREGRTSDAFALTQLLHETMPASRESLILRISAFIENGQLIDAWHCANSDEADHFPELKAICLYALEDPMWEGIASSLEHDENPLVRSVMASLLGKVSPESFSIHSS